MKNLKRYATKATVKLRRAFGMTRFVASIYGSRYRVDLDEFIDWAAYSGTFEPETERILSKLVRPGMTVLDIGANTGLYVLLLARLVGEKGSVHAFEPTTYAYDRLTDNISLNGYKNIVTHKTGLSDTQAVTRAELASSYPLRRTEGEYHPFHGGKLVTEEVSFATLDSFGLKPDLILMDTDGYEHQILKGAVRTLAHRPTIVFELLDQTLKEKGSSSEEVVRFLREHGYKLFNIDMTLFTPDASSNVVAMADDQRFPL